MQCLTCASCSTPSRSTWPAEKRTRKSCPRVATQRCGLRGFDKLAGNKVTLPRLSPRLLSLSDALLAWVADCDIHPCVVRRIPFFFVGGFVPRVVCCIVLLLVFFTRDHVQDAEHDILCWYALVILSYCTACSSLPCRCAVFCLWAATSCGHLVSSPRCCLPSPPPLCYLHLPVVILLLLGMLLLLVLSIVPSLPRHSTHLWILLFPLDLLRAKVRFAPHSCVHDEQYAEDNNDVNIDVSDDVAAAPPPVTTTTTATTPNTSTSFFAAEEEEEHESDVPTLTSTQRSVRARIA